MAILRNSTKLQVNDSKTFNLQNRRLPTSHTGCLDLDYTGRTEYDPDKQPLAPSEQSLEQNIDNRPKDWYDKQCSLENHFQILTLNSAPLNTQKGENDV